MSARERRLRILTGADTTLTVGAVRKMAEDVGMGNAPASALATAVSELTTNVIKYARSGLVILRPVRERGRPGIEAIVSDKGPGIADLDFAMNDHSSTGGTLGLGLPGARRLVDKFEITTRIGEGTRVRIVKWA